MIHNIYSQLLKLSAWDRRVFANDVERLETRLITVSSVDLNSSHQVLEEIWISPIIFVVKNQLNHQNSGTYNLQNFTSNPGPLLSTPALWFQLSWGDSIIMSSTMVMLRFTLHSFQLNLTMNIFHIHASLGLNKSMMMKWTIFYNYSTNSTTKIFCMLTYRYFRINWLLTLINIII